ncbi:VWA domain-containing protein [Fulvivirga maritima]|uniref:vWA domain-containing protein n=1 Tax=Fulvivirga maritima TaxID=2904247 RepID=UPI001F2D2085|nr:VWA domain-containing protein [Fulvivirga maritima]UII25364.1 VWA domain-containing protein [Fulvivirga maritima]
MLTNKNKFVILMAFAVSIAAHIPFISQAQNNIAVSNTDKVKIASAINGYLEIINIATGKIRKHGQLLNDYNLRVNDRYLSNGRVSKFTPLLKQLPEREKERGIAGLSDIPEGSRGAVDKLFNSIWSKLEERLQLELQLNELTQDYPPATNVAKLDSVYGYLEQIDHNYKEYYALTLKLEELAASIYDQYLANNEPSAWKNTAREMKVVIDTARSYLNKARAGHYSEESPLDTLYWHQALEQFAVDKSENLGAIKKVRGNDGSDAHQYYDLFIHHMRRAMREFHNQYKPFMPYAPQPYYYVVNEFDYAIDDYNKIMTLSGRSDLTEPPAYLVGLVKEIGLYNFSDPRKAPEPESVNVSNDADPLPINVSMEGFAYTHTVLLLDVSGSMNDPVKLPLLKQSIVRLAPYMREHDRVSVVIYSDDAQVIFENEPFSNKKAMKKLETLISKGNTDAQKGLKEAYKLAEKEFITQGNNRIIIATDGDFHIDDKTEKMVQKGYEKGVFLSVFGFGHKIYDEKRFETLTAMSGGNYLHIDEDNSLQALVAELQAVKK